MKFGLRERIMVPVVACAVVTMAAISWISYTKSKQSITSLTHDQVVSTSKSIAKGVDDWLGERKQDILAAAREPIFSRALSAPTADNLLQSGSRLKELQPAFSGFQRLALLDAEGDVVAATQEGQEGRMNMADRDYFQSAIAGEVAVGKVVQSKVTGNPVFCVAAPVRGNGRTLGCVYGAINLAGFMEKRLGDEKVGKKRLRLCGRRQRPGPGPPGQDEKFLP